MGFEKVPNWECPFVHRKQRLFSSENVDDTKMAGRKQKLSPTRQDNKLHATKKCLPLYGETTSLRARRDSAVQCWPKWYGCQGIDNALASTWAAAVGRPSKSAGCLAAREKKVLRITKQGSHTERRLHTKVLHANIEIERSISEACPLSHPSTLKNLL